MVLVAEVEVLWLESSSIGKAGTELSNFTIKPHVCVVVLCPCDLCKMKYFFSLCF